MTKQKNYDAMLIRAFREDITLQKLYYWLKPYNISLPDPELKRQPPPVKMRVRVFVGSYLKPLADRLWDTERDQDIKTLNWMVNLECDRRFGLSFKNELRNAQLETHHNNMKGAILRHAIGIQQASNQWDVTKSNLRRKRLR